MFKHKMSESQIVVNLHYQPLSDSEFAKKHLKQFRSAARATKTAQTLVRLPVWYGLDEITLDAVYNKASSTLNLLSERNLI